MLWCCPVQPISLKEIKKQETSMSVITKAAPHKNGMEGELLKLRTVFLAGEMTFKSMDSLGSKIVQLQIESNSKPINLVINSGGGSADAGLAMHDHIQHVLTVPVHALVTGECGSAATFVLLACTVRRALPNAQFLIHSGSMRDISLPISEISHTHIPRILDEIKRYDEQVTNFYMEKLGKSKDEIKELLSRGDARFNKMLFAKEALEIGLITEIVSGKAGIFPEPHNEH
jgi:ATP-dependent Clp protease protease subunit